MSEKQQIVTEFDYDRLVWVASDYMARSWNAERDKPVVTLVDDTRRFLENNYLPPIKTGASLFDPNDSKILALDEREIGVLWQRLESGRRNVEREMMESTEWRLCNKVRQEIHECLGIWMDVYKPTEKSTMTMPEMKAQAALMIEKDPMLIYHSLHRQRRERIGVEASWVDKRDSVNLIIDPVIATESKGERLSVTGNEWDEPYRTELDLYSTLDKGLVNLFSVNNFTILHFDANLPTVEKKLKTLGFETDRNGVFFKGTLRIRLKDEGSRQCSGTVHVNERGIDQILDERFDLVLRATDVRTASNYGNVAVEMRNGLRNSQMLPDLMDLLAKVEQDFSSLYRIN